MFIDKKSPIPAYYQLKNKLKDKIESGEFVPDQPIPSERELSENLNISRMTVRQALSQLVSEGFLYRERGRGTFVSKTKFEQRNIMSFSDIVKKKGLTPKTKILHFKKIEASEDIKDILQLKTHELIYDIKRLRLANDVPIGIEEVFIPEKFCPNLEKYDLTASLYKLIREEYSYAISHVDNTIEACKPSKEEKVLLNLHGSTPVLKVSGINYTQSEWMLFFERSIYRSDEYTYSVRAYVNNDLE
jgi:GntR family transcriptional regulator